MTKRGCLHVFVKYNVQTLGLGVLIFCTLFSLSTV